MLNYLVFQFFRSVFSTPDENTEKMCFMQILVNLPATAADGRQLSKISSISLKNLFVLQLYFLQLLIS